MRNCSIDGRYFRLPVYAFSAAALFSLPFTVSAEVVPAGVFASGMVLQRDRAVPVWGRGDPGEKVTVSFADKTVTGTVAADGKWRVELPPFAASSEGRILKVNGHVFKNVVVGEVWLCSGQSNMQMVLWGRPYVGKHGNRDINGYLDQLLVDEPAVRVAQVRQAWSAEERELDRRQIWRAFEPGKMSETSAVAFHYALTLHRALKRVPVGVIVSAWGGTPIEPWVSPDGYRSVPDLKDFADAAIRSDIPKKENPQYQPRAIWNAMIAPLAPFPIRGVLWYQGGSNYKMGYEYKKYLHALYNGWSRAFGDAALPFYVVQITPYRRALPDDPKASECGLWQAQADFGYEIPNGGTAIVTDVGELDNCHPADKRTVAMRLAALALNKTYGRKEVPCMSPRLRSAVTDGREVRLEFDHVDKWVMHGREKPKFELAGADGRFHPADAKPQDGGVVLLSSKEVSSPASVRYNWNWNWRGTLKNDFGLVLGPFDAVRIEKQR